MHPAPHDNADQDEEFGEGRENRERIERQTLRRLAICFGFVILGIFVLNIAAMF
jgi:hypothetical protein